MIGCVVLCLLLPSLACAESGSSVFEETQKLAGKLTALLSNQGWQRIDHVAAKRISLDPNESFTGKDVFVADEAAVVTVDNFDRKYVTTVYLLGCVYSNAVFEIVTQIKYVLQLCYREREAIRMKKKYHETNTRNQRVNSNTGNRRVKRMDPCEIFIVALKQFDTASFMLEYMRSALTYLVEMIPKVFTISSSLAPIRKLIKTIVQLKDMDIDERVRYNPYKVNEIGADDIGKYANVLLRFAGGRLKGYLARFEKHYCALPPRNTLDIARYVKCYNSRIPKLQKYKQRYTIIPHLETKIQGLIGDATENYYTNLGFVHDEDTTHTTSSPNPNYSYADNVKPEPDVADNS